MKVLRMKCAPVVFNALAKRAVFEQEHQAVSFHLAWPGWASFYVDSGQWVQVEAMRLRAFCVTRDEAAGIVAGEVRQVHLPYMWPYHFEGWTAVYATRKGCEDHPAGVIVALVKLNVYYPEGKAVGKRPMVGDVVCVRPLPVAEAVQPQGFTWMWRLPEHLLGWAREVCRG